MARALVVARIALALGLLCLTWALLAPRGRRVREAQDEPQSPPPRQPPAVCPDKPISAEQMREHTTCLFGKGEIDLWLAIDGRVYDVTHWTMHHPGGSMICHGALRDASSMFRKHHSASVGVEQLPRWCIGTISADEVAKLAE